MKYTRKKPTVSGWYWYLGEAAMPTVVLVYAHTGEVFCAGPRCAIHQLDRLSGHWFGPICEPPREFEPDGS